MFESTTVVNQGTCHEKLTSTDSSKKYSQPDYYTVVPPVAIKKDGISVPKPPNDTYYVSTEFGPRKTGITLYRNEG